MNGFEERIVSLDVSLVNAVSTATTPGDRKSLLLLQRCRRRSGEYVYLEIGLHLGGTIQQHLVDSRCRAIYSIDKRTPVQPDELRGTDRYPGNSTARMLAGLREALPDSQMEKIKTFDCDASGICEGSISARPDFCFIDGEHTNRAVLSDFMFCLSICQSDGNIALHDANIIYGGLARINRALGKRNWKGYVLQDNIYAFLLNDAITNFGAKLHEVSRAELLYMLVARLSMFKTALGVRYPHLRSIWYANEKVVRERE
jgi:hypothetical protein